ncbi:MAG: alcohol dehydrogenase catalytic domain-containing protein [Syntrophales bacterium]|jgi:L-iditol 2-dehydrogenase
MRAVQMTGERMLSVVEIDALEPDGESVIIKVSLAGICGTDLHVWEEEGYTGIIFGHEYVGTVVDPGSREDIQVGDRVTVLPYNPCMECASCNLGNIHLCMQTITQSPGTCLSNHGAFAEYIAARPDMVRKLPDTVSDIEATLIEPASVALRAVREARVTVGDKVLITGGGIIGSLCAMFAKKAGASYIAMTEANEMRAQGAFKSGDIDQVFDARDPGLIGALLEVSDPGFDVCLECAGVGEAIDTAIMAVNPGVGVIVQVALNMSPVPISLLWLVLREAKINPILGYYVRDFETCIDLIARKKIDIEHFMSRVVSFEEAQDAFVALTSGTSPDVKIAVRP